MHVNWLVLLGGVTVFFGYLLYVASDLMFLRLRENSTVEQFGAVYYVAVLGEAVVGLGFLVALVGLAMRR